MMSDEEKREMVDLFNSTLDGRRGGSIDNNTHNLHHESYALDLEERKLKAERMEAIRRQVTGWGIIVFLSGVGTAVTIFFKDHIWK